MKVSYISAVNNMSGYANAARNNIAALMETGVSVEAIPLSFEPFQADLGLLGKKIENITVNKITGNINLIHTTPNIWHKYIDSNKVNIGYCAWETTQLPVDWVRQINQMTEVWCPSQYNVEVFKNSGVNIPVVCIPHTFNNELYKQEVVKVNFQHIVQDNFIFYSIFQWHVRKNPLALLKAYLTEFTDKDNVCLMIKSYITNPNNPAEKEKIKAEIKEIKSRLYLKSYPKILLITDLLSRCQIRALHELGHCYLSFHASEGWGICPSEAALAGKPTIATDYSGTQEFIFKKADTQTGYPISYQLTPCYGMPWETYDGHQSWADINILEARQQMRYCYEHPEETKQIGLKAQQWIEQNLSWLKVGNLMKERLSLYQ